MPLFPLPLQITVVCCLLSACSQELERPLPSSMGSHAASPAPQPRGPIAQLFQLELIGRTEADVLHRAGPPTERTLQALRYVQEGCDLTVHLQAAQGQASRVQSVEVQLSPRCNLPLAPVFKDFSDPGLHLPQLTFGRFHNALGSRFYADCLLQCRTSKVFAHIEGPQALHGIEFMVSTSRQPISLPEWRDAMVATKGQLYVLHTRFNCQPEQFTTPALLAMATTHPQTLQFGRGLYRPGLQCSPAKAAV